MARPKNPAKPVPPAPAQELAAVKEIHTIRAEQDAARIHAIQQAESAYGVDLAYHVDAYISAIRRYASESAARLIEIGRMLILIREHETREVFQHALERCGLSQRFAYRAIQTARKMQDRKAIQQLGVAKALELLSEDDESLAELEDGGSIAGLTLDQIDRMSTRELRAALRAERAERAEEKAADEEVIRSKDERINKLSRRATRSSQREAVTGLMEDMDHAAVEIATHIKHLLDTAASIDSIYADAGHTVDEEVQERINLNLQTVADRLQPVLEALGE